MLIRKSNVMNISSTQARENRFENSEDYVQ